MATAFSSGLSSVLAGGAETIVARASAPGRGALAVIRLSGPQTEEVARAVCPQVDFSKPRCATVAAIRDHQDQTIERGVIVPFAAPRSYTGEDMLELTVHGSPFLIEVVIESCIAAGARQAEPGEFTRRAVANGKMDLVQAEAVRDLIDAETSWQLLNARQQLSGTLSRELADLRQSLVVLLAAHEAALDYQAQALEVTASEIEDPLATCRQIIGELLATADAGAKIRDGARVAILGPPNSGKSTLFNYLCGFERAIVSPHPGTTRDVIEAELDLDGVATILQDTAGLRTADGSIEAEGHRRALGAAAAADIVILMRAADAPSDDVQPAVPAAAATLTVFSKSDLAADVGDDAGGLRVSCRTGEGLEDFRSRLAEMVSRELPDLGGAVAISRRHRRGLERADRELAGCGSDALEIGAERVRWALKAVAELVGEVDSEDVLDSIYSAFCIGK